jgi:leucyl aminopeptidase
MAGPAFLDAPDGEYPKGGTGFGVRLLLELLEAWDSADET